MKLNEIKQALANYQKGSWIRAGWKSRIESAKSRKAGFEVLKVTEATVRIGISYSNIHAVQVMRENAEGEKKPYTIWFRHMEDFPVVVEHLQDEEKKYLQLFSVNKGANARVKYFVNGEEISRAELERSGLCNPSAFAKNEVLTFNIPIENLVFVGKRA